jgi:hypothetical protein
MRSVNLGSQRVQDRPLVVPGAGTPPSTHTEIQHLPGASTETKAADMASLTKTNHPQQTPLSNFKLSEASPSQKTIASAKSSAATTAATSAPSLGMQEIIKSTKPLFGLLQQVERDVQSAYKRREKIKSSLNDQSSTGNSPSAKDLDTFRQQRNELQRVGQGGDLTKAPAYQALKGNRPDSQLERLLPTESPFRHLLDPFTGGIRDVQTGLYAELHVDKASDDLVLVFPGTGAADMNTKQWLTNLAQFSGQGEVPAMYAQAAALAKEIQTLQAKFSFDDSSQGGLQLVGHSLGGGIANYVGLKHDIPATCYNAAALGRSCLKDLGEIPEERIVQQTHIHFKGDTVSSKKTQSRLATLLTVVWQVEIVAPRHIGVIYDLKPQDSTRNLDFWGRHRSSAFDAHYYPEAAAIAELIALKYA